MFYREAGQFKTSYAADQQVFPILQDRLALLALLAAAFVGVPLLASDYWLTALLIPFLVFALATIGLNILTGYAGQLSLGSAAFMAVGAVTAYNFELRVPGMPLLVSFAFGGVAAALVGIAFGLPSLRIKGFYLAVATLAAQFFIPWLLIKVSWFSNHSASGVITAQPMEILGYVFETPAQRYLLVLAIVARARAGRQEPGAQPRRPLLDGGARHGCGRRGDRHTHHAREADRLRGELLLLRRGGRPLRLRLPGYGGARGPQSGSVVPHPVHGHHRRGRQHPRFVSRRGVHHPAADHAGPGY